MYRVISRLTQSAAHSVRYCSTSSEAVQQRISAMVKENKVVLFMKGTPDEPMCGFSRAVVQMIDIHGVDRKDLNTHNILEDQAIREGIKEFTSWPTIPQVFMEGEFVGGCDIMLEMHKSGELIEQLKNIGIKSALDEDD